MRSLHATYVAWRPAERIAALGAGVMMWLVGGCGSGGGSAQCEVDADCPSNACVSGQCAASGDGDVLAEDVTADGSGDDVLSADAWDVDDVGPDDVHVGLDVVVAVPNPCGGTAALLYVGAPAYPGDLCGVGDESVLVCNGPDALTCLGHLDVNACGGTSELRAQPGDGCGCGGTWTCVGTDVVCRGGSGENACGGCDTLDALPGYPCRISEQREGIWQCDGAEGLVCGVGNACGGGDALPSSAGRPGEACETACGPGQWVCEGLAGIECRETMPCNGCGGADRLSGAPGAPCGALRDGAWRCVGRDAVRCEGATTPNVCGGAEVLGDSPGDICGEGRRYLCADGRLECALVLPDGVRNDCGGDVLLSDVPGRPCGSCEAGEWLCAGRNALRCSVPESAQRNVCGGCGLLDGAVGAPCGVCGDGRLECEADAESLRCRGDSQRVNTCGGCGDLSADPGDACGSCGTYACRSAARRLVCEPVPLEACLLTCDDLVGWCEGLRRSCEEEPAPIGAFCGDCVAGFVEREGICTSDQSLGRPCIDDAECGAGEWCPTFTGSANRRCSPNLRRGTIRYPFQHIPAGTYLRGSPATELARSAVGEDQVSVTLTHAFFLQRTEVTQAQWTALSGFVNPSYFQTTFCVAGACASNEDAKPNGPVERVTWWSALGFANALSVASGLPPCYDLPTSGCIGNWEAGSLHCGDGMADLNADTVYACAGYRLPTETEWEFAARAGTTTATYAGNFSVPSPGCSAGNREAALDGIAIWCANSGRRTASVAALLPNTFGLYDMVGNVFEWTADSYQEVGASGVDPHANEAAERRVLRGGSWDAWPYHMRAAARAATTPRSALSIIGFRLARTVP